MSAYPTMPRCQSLGMCEFCRVYNIKLVYTCANEAHHPQEFIAPQGNEAHQVPGLIAPHGKVGSRAGTCREQVLGTGEREERGKERDAGGGHTWNAAVQSALIMSTHINEHDPVTS